MNDDVLRVLFARIRRVDTEVANLKAHTGLDDIKREIEQESAEIRSDVNTAMTHPAIAAPATPAPAPYSGLSAEHPGYDTGEENSIAAPEQINGHHVKGEHVNEEPVQVGEPHIVPDDHVAPAPIKQDTPA